MIGKGIKILKGINILLHFLEQITKTEKIIHLFLL